MQQASIFLLAHWAVICSYLVLGTFLTRVLDYVAKKLPQYPRLTHAAAVVDDVVLDLWGLVTGIGKLIGGVAPVIPDALKKPIAIVFAGLVALLLCGCSSPLHASDPTVESTIAKACSLIGDQRKAAVKDEAKRAGLSLADAEKAFQLACTARLLGAGAEHAGLVGVQRAGLAADAGAP